MSILLASKGRAAVQVPNVTASAIGPASPQIAQVTFNPNGALVYGVDNALWFAVITPGIGNDFEVFAVAPGGSGWGGDSFDTWLSLGSMRQWTLTQSSVGFVSEQVEFRIRRSGDSTVIASGIITFYAEVSA